MPLNPRPVVRWNPGEKAWETTCRGYSVLSDPWLNKGTAFPESERAALGLTGLLPSRVLTLDQQAQRAYRQCSQQASDLDKNVYLTALHDRNEVLFYRVLTDHLSELLPIVYTPTIGEAIQQYSHQYRRPRGVYLSIDAPDQIETALRATELSADEVDLIVATDAQAILGIGDWGVGGIDIAAGKLAVYTAAGGVNPARTLPVMLDVGTDRPELLEDPLYLGVRHKRPAQEPYDAFIDAYVTAALKIFPPRAAALGGLRARQRPAHPGPLPRPHTHLQRRHAGHRRGQPRRRTGRRPRQPDPAHRAPRGHLRLRYRGHRHRRPAPSGHDQRRTGPRRGPGTALVPGPLRPAHRRHDRPA